MLELFILIYLMIDLMIMILIYSYDQSHYITQKKGYYYFIVLFGLPLMIYSMIKSIGGKENEYDL